MTGRLVGVVFLSTGAGLVAYLLTGISLPLGITVAVVVTGVAALLAWRRYPVADRPALWGRVRAGALAGVLATGAYDLTRLVVVKVFGLTFWPFDIFSRFGRLLVGPQGSDFLVTVVGTAYHYANGIGFAVGYSLLIRRVGVGTGLLWAAMLEGFMISLYPGWLGLRALDEFISVSVAGHVAYGVVLGVVVRRRLSPQPALVG